MRRALIALLVAAAVAGCTKAPPASVGVISPPLPTVRGPIGTSTASYPFLASAHDTTPIDLAQYHYSEQEFFVSGTANVYGWPDLSTLTVEASGPYTTRILIRRPTDPTRFSGNVRVEPLNPTSGHDLDAEWEIAHDGFMRSGDAYVGVTVKPATIRALKQFDPARYSDLSMANPAPPAHRCTPLSDSSSADSEDGLAWDIISQVGALLKTDVATNPLRDLHPRRSTLTGWSQSGSYDLTYLDAIARDVHLLDGRPLFDGYLPGAGSYAGTPISQCATLPAAGDPRARYNPPPGTPVIAVTSPTDFYIAASYNRRTDRPDDSDTPERRIRLYEVGGGCHLPADQGNYFPSLDELARSGFPVEDRTTYPLSDFPLHDVLDAAFMNLDRWAADGTPPPRATRLTPVDPQVWPVRPVLDGYGNPVGGVRTPSVDVPTSTYVEHGLKAPGSNNSAYAGYDITFSTQYLKILYPTHEQYVDKVTDDVRTLVAGRWLTSYDGDELIAQAQSANVPGP